MFKTREDAGRQLAKKLEMYRDKDAVILALPRGGVVTGYAIAHELHLPLDIIVIRKIGHPANPEYAICAINEEGRFLCNESEYSSINKKWLEKETMKQKEEALRRFKIYKAGKAVMNVKGRIAIIVDDGIATGLTMRLAVMVVKAQKPKHIIIAVPVAPTEAVTRLEQEVDALITLLPPEDFAGSVGAHYQEFEQVKDEEVIRLLKGY